MAIWVMQNTVRLSFGQGIVTLHEGDLIDDGQYNITTIRGAGGQLVPQMTGSNAAQAQTQKMHKRGIFDDERNGQAYWGPYVRSGQVTIANAATTGTLTFTGAEPDTNYLVSADVTASSGANLSLCCIANVTKNTANVVINLQAAPGTSNNVTFDVLIVRT